MLEYRAEFDAEVALDGGGELRARGFRLFIPHADVTEAEIADLLAAALAPQRIESAKVSDIRIVAEPHPPAGDQPAERVRFAELGHVAASGGTCLHSLSGLPLERLADLPAVVVRVVGGEPGITAAMLSDVTVTGRAVLLHTGADRHWGTASYTVGAPYLTSDGERLLADRGAALVGIDGVTPHASLLAAGIPVVEHLTNLRELPPLGARFTAVPPRVAGAGTFEVRAYATVPVEEAGS